MSSNKNSRTTRQTSLRLENLESRLNPTFFIDPMPEITTTADPLVEFMPPTIEPFVVDQARLKELTESLVESPEFLGNQVEMAFQKVLGRPSHQTGKAAWTKALASNALETEDLGIRFIATEEFLANADYNAFTMVKFLFSTFLDRQPNQEGLTNWVHQIDNLSHFYFTGKGIDAWIAMEDPKYGTEKDPHFIGLAPENRTPDQLAALTKALGTVATSIRDSYEADSQTIESLYQGILNRYPSATEIEGWRKADVSEGEMLSGFLASKEYANQYQSVQTLVAGCYAKTLFRPVGIQGLDNWSEALGAEVDDFSWISQVSGVNGEVGPLDDSQYDMVLDLIYANHVADTYTDDLSYISQFDPNFLPQMLGMQIQAAASEDLKDGILVDDQASFWDYIKQSTWNPTSGSWEYSLDDSMIGNDPMNSIQLTLDPTPFHANSFTTDIQEFIEEYWTSAWDWMDSTLIDTIGDSWEEGGGAFEGNMFGIGDNWDWTIVPDPELTICPVYPIYASYSATGDVNGDGFEDSIVSNPWNFDGQTGSLIEVYSGILQGGILYSFNPYPGQSDPVSVAVGDFDGDGFLEILTSILPTKDNLDPTGVRPEIQMYKGSDGSFLQSFPVPEEMTWTIVAETPPLEEGKEPSYTFAPGIGGVLVGARNLMTTLAGTDQIVLATQGTKLEVWVGTVTLGGDFPLDIHWTEIGDTVASATNEAGELRWPNHPILGNLAAFAISTMDVNEDGALDIGITVGSISEPNPIPPNGMDILWFDGTTHEPIEPILVPDPPDFFEELA